MLLSWKMEQWGSLGSKNVGGLEELNMAGGGVSPGGSEGPSPADTQTR